jgi:hypothetical protein
MSGFVKIWTDILHDSWVQGLTLTEKGLWIWIITMIKEAGDCGQVSCPSWRGLGVVCGCDGKTAERIIRKFHNDKKITLVENANGTICVVMPNYLYYQLVKRPGRLEARKEIPTEIPADDSSQSRSEQTEPDKSIASHIKTDQTITEQIKSEQTPIAAPAANPSSGGWRLTAEAHEVILNAYFKRFKKSLSDDDLNTLLYGNGSFCGYGSGSPLIFALNNLRMVKPGSVENPIGLLIDFLKSPGKYLSDKALGDWNNLLYRCEGVTRRSSTSEAVRAGDVIKRIISNMQAARMGG